MGLVEVLKPDPAPRIAGTRLSDIAVAHTLRCDAKQRERRFLQFDAFVASAPHLTLGTYLPEPLVKGAQPLYADDEEGGGIPVISTIAIQNLRIEPSACRNVKAADFGPNKARRPRRGDVLLTMDGGPSIGKPAVFNLDGIFAIDSHVAILRPQGMEPAVLACLLASPLGQLQFQRAESGASGQTAVTEDDLRRFRFPLPDSGDLGALTGELESARVEAQQLRDQAAAVEAEAWARFVDSLTTN